MQLTTRALTLLLLAVPLIALGAWLALFGWLALIYLIALGAVLVADWRLSPKASDWELKRIHDARLSLAVQNRINVTVRLKRGLRAVPVLLRDEPPITFGITEEERLLSGRVMPIELSTFTYYLRPPRRGDYRFGDLHLRWESPLSLTRRQATFPASAPVKVYPNLVDVKKYDLLLRKNRLWELGLRNTRLIGAGTDFERLRDYLPDDDYRRINWQATARRGKPISIEFQTERSQNIIALLDVGRLMRSPVGDVEKMDYAVNAVLLLAFVAAQKGDKVGLLTFADEALTWVQPRSGKVQFQRMLEQLYAVNGQQVESDYNRAFAYFAAKKPKRSLVLVFTDLTASTGGEALVAQMTRLRQRHLPLLVTVGDPTVQRMARQPISDTVTLYQRTVAEQLLDERRVTMDRLRSHGVLTLDVPADELSIGVINRYLDIKAKGMI